MCLRIVGIFEVRGAFSKYYPGTGVVNRFTVNRHPITNIGEEFRGGIVECAVRLGGNIKQEVAVLGDDINQFINNLTGRTVLFIAVPSPIPNGSIGLPGLLANLAEMSPLPIEGGDSIPIIAPWAVAPILDKHDRFVLSIMPTGVGVIKFGNHRQASLPLVISIKRDSTINIAKIGLIIVDQIEFAIQPLCTPANWSIRGVS